MTEANKAAVRRIIEEFLTTGDPDVANALFAADYVDHSVSHPEFGGHENVKKSTRG